MNTTIIMNAIDTIASNDTIVVKLVKATEVCQPIVKEAETNCYDFAIVFCICTVIALIAIIGICKFFADKKKEREILQQNEVQRNNWENQEKERKGNAEEKNRNQQLEDQLTKQKNDLLNKYLDFLKDQTDVKENEIKNEQYRSVLEYLIELSQRNKLNEISDEKLKSLFSTPQK